MADDRVPIQMYVHREVRRKLNMLAAEREISISELMRQAVQKYLDSESVEINLSEGLDTWGRYSKGKPNEE